MPVTYIAAGSIVDDTADILVNTVNTVGIMGKGVALAFKQRWPQIMPAYQHLCRQGGLRPGDCALLDLPDGRRWAALATKQHWARPSQYDWVEHGLVQLARLAGDVGATSIAIPPPGCGNGGLDWERVRPMVLRSLGFLDLRIYARPPRA